MRRKLWIALALAAVMALVSAGCGSAATGSYMKDAYAPSLAAPSDGYYYAETPATAPAQPEASTSTGSQLPANVKMIYTANIQMETTEFERAAGELTALVNRLGGYFESSGVSSYGSGYRSADYTVRVPAQHFDTFCSEAGSLCKINRINRSAEDVSEAYYDVESRLATQRTKLERLQALLAQAEDMEDIITLESAISDTELQIERLTGSLRHYDSLVGYATVYIGLQEVYKTSPDEAPAIGFWAKLGAAFRTGSENLVDGAENLMLGFAENWGGWLVFAVVVVILILLIRRWRQRRRETYEERAARRQAKAERRAAKKAKKLPVTPPAEEAPKNE